MNFLRLTALQSLPRALSRRPLRNLSTRTPLRSKYSAEGATDAINGAKPKPKHILDEVSLHRAAQLKRAAAIRRRNWLALGAALSMIAPMVLIKIWPIPEHVREEIEAKKRKNAEDDQKEKDANEQSLLEKLDILKPTRTDSPKGVSQTFQGKPVVVAPGDRIVATPNPEKATSILADDEAVELVPTGTSYIPYFPKTITVPSTSSSTFSSSTALTGARSANPEDPEYTLLGLGIRKVSFLRVQVYVLGLYVRTSHLSTLQNHLINTVNPSASTLISNEKDELRNALLDPEKSNQIWEGILSKKGVEGVDMAIRVVPVRGTDFKHLQDGWMRGVASRTDEVRRRQNALLQQQAQEQKKISLPKPVEEGEFEDESFGAAMKEFKGLFQGRGKAPKGSVITLTRDRDGTFGALYQSLTKFKDGKEKLGDIVKMGEVKDERVSRLVWLLYLGGKNVSSEDARKNIVEGCVGIVERPVGTVEARVL
ncbi:hypothetical protein GQ43DRAFT_443494 [Delitschia confertaspora ATCC 74209]|uniref:Chalcone isomerase domain-containing protein n=1 Tax=Delitschia confertaspora ATCC 74209 TaxID=1513339 RepID=A0A9P4JHB9_9PLEO|nr:hypothetical protein GQ43DRAFT_443494 [Delitschia confertaspora ATCC 74209]